MNRAAFLAKLREGLSGLPPQTIADILADHEAHFAEGEAAGRTDADVATALGDPARLARELRAEQSLKRWEAERNPSAATAAIVAVLGLCALDIMFVLPFLAVVFTVLIAFFVAAIVGLFAGGGMLAMSPFYDGPGGIWGMVLASFAVMGGAIAAGSVLTLITAGLVNALVWFGRLHFRLLKPAVEA